MKKCDPNEHLRPSEQSRRGSGEGCRGKADDAIARALDLEGSLVFRFMFQVPEDRVDHNTAYVVQTGIDIPRRRLEWDD